MDECFFAESLKEMFFYNLLFQIVFNYVVLTSTNHYVYLPFLLFIKNTVFVFLHQFYTHGSKMTHIQVHLNKLECRGKVNLFQ